jgi:hypothetical protein
MNKINIILFLILIVLLMFYCNTKLFKNNVENYKNMEKTNRYHLQNYI